MRSAAPGVLSHVQRVFVSHVDDRRADLDPFGPGADSRKEREWRTQLPGEMMHAIVSPVGAQLLHRDRQVYRLEQGIGSRSRL